MSQPLDDLRRLSPADRLTVCRFIEDRFLNAIHPLAAILGILAERPESLVRLDLSRIAHRTVDRVLDAVSEVRTIATETTDAP